MGDLLTYPFNPNVWGTVSDWSMVIVTAITAIYLIRTFKEQQRITGIELISHKERIQPRFLLSTELEDIAFSQNREKFRAVVNFIFTVENFHAYKVEIETTKPLLSWGANIEIFQKKYPIINKGYNKTAFHIEVHSTDSHKVFNHDANRFDTVYDYGLGIKIYFEDIEGGKYMQEAMYILSYKGNEKVEMFPVIEL